VTSFGPIDTKGGSSLNVSDPKNLASGGSVFIPSGALTIDGSEINTDNYSSGNAGSVVTTESLRIADNGTISVSTRGSGDAGSSIVTAGTISIASGGQISSSFASGKAGPVSIAVADPLAIDDRTGDGGFGDVERDRQCRLDSRGGPWFVDARWLGRCQPKLPPRGRGRNPGQVAR
jgi:hypothetical protein